MFTRFLLLAACILSALVHQAHSAPAKPNIIFILADDSGLGEFGCYGGKVIPTPNIDSLAAEGMRFDRAYSGSAVCAPTRCVLMTGLHPGHAHRRANQMKGGIVPLPPEEVTVAEVLKKAGYATGGFGKWGLGNPGTIGVPEKQGFDLWYGYYDQKHAHSYFPSHLVRNSEDLPLPGNADNKRQQYAHDLIEAETLKFIESNKDQPFFCYAAWTLPHGKFEIPSHAAFADRSWPEPVKIHAAMISRMDDSVGRVLAKLKELGIDKNTLVIFSSDNGADGPGVKTFNATAGLRGIKRHLHEGGIRAPFIARWPGQIKSGTTSDLLTGHVDILATAADLAGVPAPKSDGISIVPTLLGRDQKVRHDFLYWEIYEGPTPFQQAVRMGDWKGYRCGTKDPLEVYNLKADAGETKNVAAANPKVVKNIEAIMTREHSPSPYYATPEFSKTGITQKPRKEPKK
ncbi:MAG: arylsulfatase [Verrucomicrobia bacterium]|nr:arylsulfatase [Verrucomicrobiota bacterium]